MMSVTLSLDASLGCFFTSLVAPFNIERTWSGDMSDAPSVTFADAVIFDGLPETVRNLSIRTATA